jgi:hypothetical protein
MRAKLATNIRRAPARGSPIALAMLLLAGCEREAVPPSQAPGSVMGEAGPYEQSVGRQTPPADLPGEPQTQPPPREPQP